MSAEHSYSLCYEVGPYLISEEELAGVKERLSTVEFPFAFENLRTGETLSVSKTLPLIELDLQ